MASRISRHQMLMMMAQAAALRSTCSRAQVGAIVALDARPLVSGYNGTPAGMPHCHHGCTCRVLTTDERTGLIPTHHEPRCATQAPCALVVHAEANAIAYAARSGVMLGGAIMFVTLSPCYPCAQLIINAGIVEVVYASAYRDVSGLTLLENAGVRTCLHQE